MLSMASGYVLQKVASVTIENAIRNTLEFNDFIYDSFYLEAKTFYLFVVENNSSTSTYKGLKCIKFQQNSNNKDTQNMILVREANATTSVNTQWLFDVETGSTVTLYKLP